MSTDTDLKEFFAACTSKDWGTVKYEIPRQFGSFADFCMQNKADDNKTVLHYACDILDEPTASEMVAYIFGSLKEHPYDNNQLQKFVNTKTSEGHTALHFAINHEYKSVIEQLIMNSADVEVKSDKDKKDALGLIYDRVHTVMTNIFTKGFIIKEDTRNPRNDLLWDLSCDFYLISGVEGEVDDNQKPESANTALIKSSPPNAERSNHKLQYQQARLLARVLLQEDKVKRADVLLHPLAQIFLYLLGCKLQRFTAVSIIFHVIWFAFAAIYFACNCQQIDNRLSSSSNNISTFEIIHFKTTNMLADLSVELHGQFQNTEHIQRAYELVISKDINLTVDFTMNVSSIPLQSELKLEEGFCSPFFRFEKGNLSIKWFFWVMLVVWLIALAKEILEMYLCPSWRMYRSQWENYGQWIVLGLLVVQTVWGYCLQKYGSTETSEFWTGSLFITNTVGMGASLWLIQEQATKTEWLGIYNLMLYKVLRKFSMFFVSFLPLFAAFMFLFGRVFPKSIKNEIPWIHGVNKILSMMAGELEHDKLFDENPDLRYKIPGAIIFLLFAFSVTFLLYTLLLGWTVADIQRLEKKARVRHLTTRLELFVLIERFLTCSFGYRIISKIFNYENLLLQPSKKNTSSTDQESPELQSYSLNMKDLPEELQKVVIEHKNKFHTKQHAPCECMHSASLKKIEETLNVLLKMNKANQTNQLVTDG